MVFSVRCAVHAISENWFNEHSSEGDHTVNDNGGSSSLHLARLRAGLFFYLAPGYYSFRFPLTASAGTPAESCTLASPAPVNTIRMLQSLEPQAEQRRRFGRFLP